MWPKLATTLDSSFGRDSRVSALLTAVAWFDVVDGAVAMEALGGATDVPVVVVRVD